jgi:ABC-2 type transport system permease protein
MSRTWTIATREFRRTVLTKAFFIGAVAIPVFFVAVSIAADLFLKPTIHPLDGKLAVSGGGVHFVEALQMALQDERDDAKEAAPSPTPRGGAADVIADAVEAAAKKEARGDRPDTSELQLIDETTTDPTALRGGVRDGTWVAAIIVTPSADGVHPTLELIVPPSAPRSHVELLEDATRTAAVDARLLDKGLQPAEIRSLVARPRVRTVRLDTVGGERTEAEWTRWVIPVLVMGLIWMTTLTGGNYLLTSTIEEKSSKVIEVLLSACGPGELIHGKIIGFGMVTMLMLAMYAAVAAVILTLLAVVDLISLTELFVSGACMIMAYLMIASMMAGAGAAVSDLTEAQTLMGPVMIVLMLPLLLIPVVTEDPGGIVATVATFIPPMTPFILVLRVTAAVEPLPWWEVVGALIFGFGAAAGMVWAAGRVFRVGILMQGKPPSPRELLRWIRYR